MSKEKILTIDDLPMHKDTYFFGYGIDIDKPYEMANQIIKLRKENQELKKQLEECSAVADTNSELADYYKEVIDKAIEYISELDDNTDDTTCYDIDKDIRGYILSILKEVK